MSLATGDDDESQPSTIYTSSTIYNSFPVQWSQPCRSFEYHEILSATKNFDESLLIGCGGYGKVYKGNVIDGVVAAIKRLYSMSHQGDPEFWAEVEALSKLRHANLASLIGYCNHEDERILVYEYIPIGTLDDHLHRFNTCLCWTQRLKICIGAARALDYLHTGTGIEFGVIHRDVKSSNIMLDKSWEPKISDFGFSRIVPRDHTLTNYVDTQVKGTFGYVDPHYYVTGKVSRKSDVYAFGVVLLEVLCRKRAVCSLEVENCSLVRWAQDSIKAGCVKNIIDSDIRDEISLQCLVWFVQIAERCLDINPEHRPAMAKVVSTLVSILNLQERANSSLQDAGKTIFDRQTDMFSITAIDKNSGMEFGFRMPKTRKLLMLREKILQQNGFLPYKKFSRKILQLKPNCFGSIKIFGAKDLEKATNNYAQDRILGRGAQGIVYKGILPDKRLIAIKSHRILGQSRLEQLITEIVILEKINHKNVVKLLGCCFETEGAMLIYEFVSNRTLHHLIHDGTTSTRILSWDCRLRIAHESANAIAYLHTYSTISIVHRDVKSANILLDENYTAKVSDFGSSRLIPLKQGQITTKVEGTLGYMDPEYFDTYQVTCKTDVYGFGVVLAELLTGQKPIDRKRNEDDGRLSTYFVQETKENRLCNIVDQQVLQEATNEQLNAACGLVHRCLEPSSVNRPSMKEVTKELETIRNLGKHPLIS